MNTSKLVWLVVARCTPKRLQPVKNVNKLGSKTYNNNCLHLIAQQLVQFPCGRLTVSPRASAVKLLGDGATVRPDYPDNGVTVRVPTNKGAKLVELLQIDLSSIESRLATLWL